MDILLSLGLHRMWVSRSFGGHQVSLATGTAILRTIAERDASVAWQFAVQSAIGRVSDYLPKPVAAAIFDPEGPLVVGHRIPVLGTGPIGVIAGSVLKKLFAPHALISVA